ncbi:MAG: oxidoreductase [Patescibacteria group bacterium]|nr:oxidoreductase [Candidatus Saccharimonadaceae bacterium]MDD4271685.1 oxidoreductase [Patescibacteria group bacterium]
MKVKKLGTTGFLKGKVCLIAGGAGFLGKNFSKAMAAAGATVIIADIDSISGEKIAEAIRRATKNNSVVFHRCDINQKQEVNKLVEAVVKKFGRIDALINNADPMNKNRGRKFEDVTYEDFCENINLHIGGYFLMAKEVAKQMKMQGKGNIINIGSIYGCFAPKFEIYKNTDMTMPIEYAAAKGAIINLTKYLASYLGKYNIRVNCLSPGGVFNNQPESFVKKYSAEVILGRRMAEPEDLSGVLLFLLSNESGYMTGQNIVVDGGWSL